MKKIPFSNETGEVRELTEDDIKSMRPAHEVLPDELLKVLPKRKIGQRGPQKHPVKIAVTLRYSAEVIDYFKSFGSGWQSRMDKALKEWIKKHPHTA